MYRFLPRNHRKYHCTWYRDCICNSPSLIRIMGSVLLEQNDMYAIQKKITTSKKDYEEMLKVSAAKLCAIAKEQQRLLVA